jgi:hypothetical protein
VTYVLSTLVQLRSSFVFPAASGPDTGSDEAGGSEVRNLLETLPPCDVFGALFDRTFIIGAVGGVAVRWMDERVNS